PISAGWPTPSLTGDRGGLVSEPSRRDRDPAGRARNARPRDALGRPLPRSAAQDVPRIPDDLVISPAEAAALGGRLLAEGQPFHAHEVFEAAWKSLPGPDRELWRGLAQVAVGLTHARRGNARGATALLRRGAGHVAEFAGTGLANTGPVNTGLQHGARQRWRRGRRGLRRGPGGRSRAPHRARRAGGRARSRPAASAAALRH